MLVIIDESGDTGFKNASSRYFILTMVVFPEVNDEGRYLAAEHVADTIKAIQETTGHRSEFHFTACSNGVRSTFFHEINRAGCEFHIYSLVVDKSLVSSDVLKKNSTKFYNFFLKQLLTHNPINGATIKIDGSKSKLFRKALQSYLRKGNSGLLTKLKFCDSKNDVLVQLADMVCGAIAFSYNRKDRLNSGEFFKLLGGRLRDVWEFK